MNNYFNSLTESEKIDQLSKCRFMNLDEFKNKNSLLKNKKIVIVGCGAQGLNQGLNMQDSGLDISYALRASSIASKRPSFINATSNGFNVGTFEKLIPNADVVINLTPDKNHTQVVKSVMPLMKKNSVLSYSHGFNIVEEGVKIREDITVIMVAPKCPGTEVREEFKRGFGVPTLIAVHYANDPKGLGLELAKAYAYSLGSHRAGVLESSFVAEVKSDLMGEQTILCGVLQTASILLFDKMVSLGIDKNYASKLLQNGWEVITESLKHGGIAKMMDQLSDQSKVKACELSDNLKSIMKPLFEKHMDDIISGEFSLGMMKDWDNDDVKLLNWREETGNTNFEKTISSTEDISTSEYFEKGIVMIAFVKSGVELAFETMVSAGIIDESAYYESLHELPLIANLVSRKKLYEMNSIISDTAEYGCYLFSNKAKPLLESFIDMLDSTHFGVGINNPVQIDQDLLKKINFEINNHPIEKIGLVLRKSMTAMKNLF
tara:strand:- start:153 stop:1622 length:1470 start_codon:yes stop_codon:yes gene_type:complete